MRSVSDNQTITAKSKKSFKSGALPPCNPAARAMACATTPGCCIRHPKAAGCVAARRGRGGLRASARIGADRFGLSGDSATAEARVLRLMRTYTRLSPPAYRRMPSARTHIRLVLSDMHMRVFIRSRRGVCVLGAPPRVATPPTDGRELQHLDAVLIARGNRAERLGAAGDAHARRASPIGSL